MNFKITGKNLIKTGDFNTTAKNYLNSMVEEIRL